MSLKPHFYTIAESHVMGKLKSSRNLGGPKESSGDCHESSELKFKSRGQQLISNPLIKSKTMVKGVTTLECNICGTTYRKLHSKYWMCKFVSQLRISVWKEWVKNWRKIHVVWITSHLENEFMCLWLQCPSEGFSTLSYGKSPACSWNWGWKGHVR